MARLPCGSGTTVVSLADIDRMMKSEGETLVSGAKVDGWTVSLFCTGTLEFQFRKLLVMGATLGGSWYKPPQTVSDATVTVILKANKTPVHYGVASVPYKRGIAATWQSECNTQVVEMYKRVIVDLFSLGLDKTAPTFLGVSAGVLSIMASFSEIVENAPKWGLVMPNVFLVSGAWHPVEHPRFAASLKRFEREQARCYVLNHVSDAQCSWKEQQS